MPRIAYVCTDPGIPVFGAKGASVHVQEVLRVLCRDGHRVELHAARIGGEPPPDLAEVVVHDHGRPSGVDTADRERACRAADADLERRLVAADDADLVYERYALWGGAGVRAADRLGMPSILEVNAPLVDEQADHRVLHDREAAEAHARAAADAATVVACVSDEVADWMRARVDDPRKVHVVPNGVDTDRIQPGEARDPAAFTIGFVGNLRPWHGVDTLVRAVARLRTGTPDARLLLVGDGDGREDLVDLASRHEVPVEVTGTLPPADVPAQLHRMDVATAPYPADATYFSPLKVYEYLAAGLPIVASDVGQVRQALEQGRAGLLVPPGDPDALAGALKIVARRPAVARRLRTRARTLAVTRHTWTRTVRRTLALADRASDLRAAV